MSFARPVAPPTAEATAFREALWEVYDPDRDLDDAYVRDLIGRAAKVSGARSSHLLRAGNVRRWLTDPDWSPHVDDVALERAAGFDWEAIRSLNHAEFFELVRRLAAMFDPFSLLDDDTRSVYDRHDTGPGRAGARRLAWLSAPRGDRVRLARSVYAARKAASWGDEPCRADRARPRAPEPGPAWTGMLAAARRLGVPQMRLRAHVLAGTLPARRREGDAWQVCVPPDGRLPDLDPVRDLLTTREAAQILGVGVKYVYARISDGRLPTVRAPGGVTAVRRSVAMAAAELEGRGVRSRAVRRAGPLSTPPVRLERPTVKGCSPMASTITVYSQPRCVQCGATYRKLDRLDVEYRVVDVSEDPAAAEMVKALGYFAAPVVVVQTPDGGEHWTGFKPDKLERAAELVRTAQSVSAVA